MSLRQRSIPIIGVRLPCLIAPLGLWLLLDAGMFNSVRINPADKAVRLGLTAATLDTPVARLRIEQPATVEGVGTYRPAGNLKNQRGAFVIPLASEAVWLEMIPSNQTNVASNPS